MEQFEFMPPGVLPHQRKLVKYRSVQIPDAWCAVSRGRVELKCGLHASPFTHALLGVVCGIVLVGMTAVALDRLLGAFDTGLTPVVLVVYAFAVAAFVLGFGYAHRRADSHSPLATLDLKSRTLSGPEGHYSLTNPPATCIVFANGNMSRNWGSLVSQLILVRTDAQGRHFGRAVATIMTSADMGKCLRHLAAYARVPVYVVHLGWRETPRASVELREPSTSAAYWRELGPFAPSELKSDQRIERVVPLCMQCNYDLIGLDAPSHCPECGCSFVE